MLTLNKSPLVLQDFFELEDKDNLIKIIQEKASRDQSKTSIRLNTAYCNIYQPWKHESDDFLEVNKIFSKKISQMLKARYKVTKETWGLDYKNGEGTNMHAHPGKHELSAVYYLMADEGCGTLVFKTPDIEIEPKPGMFLVFNNYVAHGVLPSINPDARRVCIAMNAKYIDEPIRLS